MRLPLSVSTVALLIFVSALAVMDAPSADAGNPFNPTFEITLDDPFHGENSGYEMEVGLGIESPYPFRVVHFLPAAWSVTPGDQLPEGVAVGTVDTDATLGFFNAPCNQELPIHFDLYNASTDSSDIVLYGDGDQDGEQDIAEDEDSNGLPDAIDKYPDILVRMFPGVEPMRRYAAITMVAGSPTLLQYLTFPEGTQVPGSARTIGYPVVTVVSNIGDPEILQAPYPITDYCTPLVSRVHFFGQVAGVPLFTNPAQVGGYTFDAEVISMPDADGDGYENTLDTCPLVDNVGTPKVAGSGDEDLDGLDVVCDPNDDPAGGGTNSDQDNDGYLNRQDLCPLAPDGQDGANQADSDHDYIGDFCDPDPFHPNGVFLLAVRHEQVFVVGESPVLAGDVDCDGHVTTRDAQVIVRSVVGNPIELPPACPDPGDPVG